MRAQAKQQRTLCAAAQTVKSWQIEVTLRQTRHNDSKYNSYLQATSLKEGLGLVPVCSGD